jgi:hypothetical protein
MSTLVIIPCGKAKVWDKSPGVGPVAAKDAYTGAPFKVNREYAEATGKKWMILSAKYGFIEPDFCIPETYNVTFKKRATRPISVPELMAQSKALNLHVHDRIIALGGVEYRTAVREAFAGTSTTVEILFEGLPQGPLMSAVKKATAELIGGLS